MSGRTIRIERPVDAPPERAYRMWSDADTMTSWLCHEVQGSLLPGARSVLVFPRERLPVDVLEAIPSETFRFRWFHSEEGGLATEVTVTFKRRGYGTTVTLTDGPYDVSDEAQLDAYAFAIEMWAEALVRLRAQVDYSVDLRMRN